VQEILDQGVVRAGPREAQWILDVARDGAHAVDLARRRAAGEPLQYVTGDAYFRRLKLAVGPGVLVPRPETELVAERAMARLPDGGTLVDVGSGSGAIALSVKDERPDARVIATEIDDKAFDWLLSNISATGLEIETHRSDLLVRLPIELDRKIDVIVSNPPYVSTEDAGTLPVDVVEHEPPAALFAGSEGLAVILRLVPEAHRWLRPGGWLVVEIGESQAEEVSALMRTTGFEAVAVHDDLARRPRIIEGRAR